MSSVLCIGWTESAATKDSASDNIQRPAMIRSHIIEEETCNVVVVTTSKLNRPVQDMAPVPPCVPASAPAFRGYTS